MVGPQLDRASTARALVGGQAERLLPLRRAHVAERQAVPAKDAFGDAERSTERKHRRPLAGAGVHVLDHGRPVRRVGEQVDPVVDDLVEQVGGDDRADDGHVGDVDEPSGVVEPREGAALAGSQPTIIDGVRLVQRTGGHAATA